MVTWLEYMTTKNIKKLYNRCVGFSLILVQVLTFGKYIDYRKFIHFISISLYI